MPSKKLVELLDNRSIDLSRLATLLQAQQDELEDVTDIAEFKQHKPEIQVISNLVMNHLQKYGHQLGKISNKYYATGKYDRK